MLRDLSASKSDCKCNFQSLNLKFPLLNVQFDSESLVKVAGKCLERSRQFACHLIYGYDVHLKNDLTPRPNNHQGKGKKNLQVLLVIFLIIFKTFFIYFFGSFFRLIEMLASKKILRLTGT